MPEVSSNVIRSQENHQLSEFDAMSDLVAPGSDGESDSSENIDNDAVLITRNAEGDRSVNDQNEDDEDRIVPTKKRVNNFSNSGSEVEDHNLTSPVKTHSASASSDEGLSKAAASKSRIRKLDSDSDSDSHQSSIDKPATKMTSENDDHPSNHNLTPSVTHSTSDNSCDEGISKVVPPRNKQLDSDSDSDAETRFDKAGASKKTSHKEGNTPKKVLSRIKLICTPSSDNSDSEPESPVASKYEEQKARMKEKRNKMQQKFKSLITSRAKETEEMNQNGDEKDSNGEGGVGKEEESSNNSDDEAASIERIKQKIKDKTNHLKSTVYDPDTSSDEERTAPKQVHRQKKRTKSTKPTSPKPMRMSAKQAMENMQKIKSESNRMLREKEVSLPYHRPKALSLKDIMSRRRPAVTADGKALPLKMNDEQLKQYASMLEERQKEMMELCKSDTEDENDEITSENKENTVDTDNTEKNLGTVTIESNLCTDNVENKKDSVDLASQNDSLYDNLAQEKIESILNAVVDVSSKMEVPNAIEVPNPTNDNVTDDVDMKDEITAINKDESAKNAIGLIYEVTMIKSSNNEDVCLDSDPKSKEANTEYETESEMHLVYNDSIEEIDKATDNCNTVENIDKVEDSDPNKIGTELDSQIISLHYDTENTENVEANLDTVSVNQTEDQGSHQDIERAKQDADPKDLVINSEDQDKDRHADLGNFSDDDINMDDIDKIIEDAEIIGQNNSENYDSPMLIREPNSKLKPKLTGAPGMIIDLDGTDPTARRKLTGVELLKERFTYFATLKTPEEMEREREKRLKPGMQHLKLKQELENEMAEQRSLEWTKRLEEEKQLHQEINLEKEEGSDADDIDKIDAKIEEAEGEAKESSGESEPEENDCEITDKPLKRNPMISDEAIESDDDDDEAMNAVNDNGQDSENDDGDDEESDDESSDEKSESEDEQPTTKKGRILKAFEDSDDETEKQENTELAVTEANNLHVGNTVNNAIKENGYVNTGLKDTQDDDLQLAQELNSQPEDLFESQESSIGDKKTPASSIQSDYPMGTQSFSITNTITKDFTLTGKLTVDDMQSQCYGQEGDLDAVVGMCSGSFSQSLSSQQTSQLPTSQVLGEDVLALCTGKFYDGPFVSQVENGHIDSNTSELNNAKYVLDKQGFESQNNDKNVLLEDLFSKGQDTKINGVTESVSNLNDTVIEDQSINIEPLTELIDTHPMTESIIDKVNGTEHEKPKDDLLESILGELNEPDVRNPKKYFFGTSENKENKHEDANTQFKKKFIIESDDEENAEGIKVIKKKKRKRNLEKRALQISDDESELSDGEEFEGEEYMSDLEDDEERIVEYDSEENEVEIKPQNPKPKKQRAPDFFEQEAELTSEDEWIGSGDEDEAGLDRMEREAGDDDTFNQATLQRELGQIHMRDVLDQDKREVRIIQELLFEDGDLGTGSRQRKFRWKNADGVEETGTMVEHLPDTQEQEVESEEQWRKQRYERELFLREMQKQNETEGIVNISMETSIKANLSKSIASAQELHTSVTTTEVLVENKTARDVPSPKKSAFTLFKQSYHGSLLTRGQGALARLAALATPLAVDDDAPSKGSLAPSSKRNFVFATITPDDAEPKVTKRKAETNTGTPRLVKKMRTEDKPKNSKSSLFDYMKV